MGNTKIIAAALLLLSAPFVQSKEPAPHVHTIERFMAAFNAHDSNAMAMFVTDDIDWLSVSGEKVTMETRGKSQLVASMDAYFESCPTCRSELSELISTPDRVSAVEIAKWHGKTGPQSQRSLSVYEFSNGLIRRVYYFPAEK